MSKSQETKQRVFDLALNHIRTTQKRSVSVGLCIYSGSGCALAPIIKTDCVTAADATGDIIDIVENNPSFIKDEFSTEVSDDIVEYGPNSFYVKLQKCHDEKPSYDFLFMVEFELRMKALARQFELQYSPSS